MRLFLLDCVMFRGLFRAQISITAEMGRELAPLKGTHTHARQQLKRLRCETNLGMYILYHRFCAVRMVCAWGW